MKKIYALLKLKIAILAAVFISAFLPLQNAMASHAVGGEITYTWVSGNIYNVKLSFYRDCSGIPAPTTVDINCSSSCDPGFVATLNMSGTGIPVSPICAASLANSACNGGTLYSVEQYTYEGIVTLPVTCSDWEFSFNTCCRNAAITNLVNASGFGMYLAATLDNQTVPFNNSVQFGGIPVNIINNNTTTSLGWSTYDVDGDSVYYELVPARDFSGGPVILSYNAGLSAIQPFTSSSPTTLDAGTGILTVSPNALQFTVVSMKISEYRLGVNVGTVYRDYQIAVINSGNNLPTLSGINGTSNFVTNGCPGDTITFDVYSNDIDPIQNVTLIMDGNQTNAALNSTLSQHPVGTFTWVPGPGDISSQPYTFTINVDDDNCDYFGTQTFAYQVYVNGCNTNDVWPGDANSDGNANLYDLLAIGLAYNDNGPVRPSASLSWNAQPCPDWTNSFPSTVNHKHADTDGNGTVDLMDTLAIMQNYGLNHPLRLSPVVSSINPDLAVVAGADTVGTSTSVNFDVLLSDSNNPVDSIYGLAFRLYFDPALIDTNSIAANFSSSLFGTQGADMIQITKTSAGIGKMDIAVTGINHTNYSGYGPVVRVTIVTTDNVSGKVQLNVTPGDIVAVTESGSLLALNPVGDGVTIDPNFVGIVENNIESSVDVYPTPASDMLHINIKNNIPVNSITLLDVTGNEVRTMNHPSAKTTMDVKGLAKGVYILNITSGDQIAKRKVMIF